MSLEVARRPREARATLVVLPLLVLHLILISIQIEDPGGTTLFRKGVLIAVTPFLNGSAAVVRGAAHLWRNYLWLVGARAENELLNETVRRLKLRDQSLRQMQDENERLRRLLSFREQSGLRTIGARVVGRVPNFLSNVMYIDRGLADGVAVDMPVLSGEGVVGRTVVVSPHQSQVQLITNSDASLGVMLAVSHSPGVLSGTGGIELRLDYINNTEKVAAGDVVVTSGLDSVFPKGIPVGQVVKSQKGKTVFRDIQVRPFAGMLRSEEVLVVLGGTMSPGEGGPQGP
ncbi:MAG: rod shape-determining protein MreC [Acidobacteria bacterium]|nr:rod shape-determining protein MreC [Acidobacteriota bacterium]